MDDQKRYRVYLCGNIHCLSRGSETLLQQLERELWDRQLDTTVEVYMGGCQDQCDYGPNMIIWPGPYRYAGLDAKAISRIVEQHLAKDEPVAEYLATPEMRR
jgi:(2Fe-2S) ferredoxin